MTHHATESLVAIGRMMHVVYSMRPNNWTELNPNPHFFTQTEQRLAVSRAVDGRVLSVLHNLSFAMPV